MAKLCRPCHKGDHADCTRWLMRDHPCTCVCDEAPRQLTLPGVTSEVPAVPIDTGKSPVQPAITEEVPW